jgi:3-oxoacyl-(acyl-carrier-protein) synthase
LQERIHIAGAGIISAIGASWKEVFDSLKAGRAGIAYSRHVDTIHRDHFPVGEVPMSNEELRDHLQCAVVSRTTLLAWYAVKQALAHAGDFFSNELRVGLISGTTVGGMDATERFYASYLENTYANADVMTEHPCGIHAAWMARQLGIDYVNTINTACSSSLNAIALGCRMIKANQLDVVIAGGTDALTAFTLNGFNSLMIVDKQLTRPFDATRQGLNLGEGAGYVVLVSERVKQQLVLPSLGTVSGYANTNDAFHQTASSPDGKGSYEAMRQALQMASLETTDIDYINLHGTGTVNNDLSEGTAIQNLYGKTPPSMSSTKAYTGHTLGASGGIEAIISLMSLQHQCVFPNLRFSQSMPELSIIPQVEFEEKPVKHVMTNAFGFGGNCSAMVLSK